MKRTPLGMFTSTYLLRQAICYTCSGGYGLGFLLRTSQKAVLRERPKFQIGQLWKATSTSTCKIHDGIPVSDQVEVKQSEAGNAEQLIWWAMEVVITSLPFCSTKTSNLLCISLGRVASWLPQALNTLRQRPKKYHHLHTHLDITSVLTLCKSQLLQTPAFRASCAGKHVLPQSNCSDSYWYLLSKLQFVSQTICRHVFFLSTQQSDAVQAAEHENVSHGMVPETISPVELRVWKKIRGPHALRVDLIS